MPAIAVTEHGNLFSSVIFHDHARARGLKPILGCEVYVAPGEPAHQERQSRARRRTIWCCSPRRRGYHNLIKLVSAGYTEGFYYKPRIDKELLAQHAKGLIGLSSCLKGEVAEGLSHQQDRKALEAAAAYRDILGPDNFFLEMQWHGIEEQRIVNTRPAGDRARPRPAAGLHQRRPLPARQRRAPARRPAVHRHRQGVQRSEAPALRRASSSS